MQSKLHWLKKSFKNTFLLSVGCKFYTYHFAVDLLLHHRFKGSDVNTDDPRVWNNLSTDQGDLHLFLHVHHLFTCEYLFCLCYE